MPNHTAVKLGGWLFRDPITSTQMTGFQERLLRCPNFESGSTHSLTADLTVSDGGGNVLLRTNGELGATQAHVWSIGAILDLWNGGNLGRIAFPAGRTSLLTGNVTRSADETMFEVIGGLDGANRTITLLHTGARDGDAKIYINRDAGYSVNLADEVNGASDLGSIGPGRFGIAVYLVDRWYGGTIPS